MIKSKIFERKANAMPVFKWGGVSDWVILKWLEEELRVFKAEHARHRLIYSKYMLPTCLEINS
jgi:hypothetical protein